jgi:uncharacterized protein YceK
MKRSIIAFLILFLLSGCASIKEVANLRNVDFGIDALTDLRIAGVETSGIRGYEDLGALDIVRIGAAVARKELPVSFILDVLAQNPAENGVQARMVGMDWTLLLEDRETISGVFQDEVVIPAGETRHLPIRIELDLIRFFEGNARDLVDLALSLTGEGGSAKNVTLRAVPTIQTIVGPVRYPEPITIISTRVG